MQKSKEDTAEKPTKEKEIQPIEHYNKVSSTERQWKMLSMINRGKWVGTVYIQEQLRLVGFHVTLRTVQRDLVALSKRFLIEHNHSNPQGWRWQDDAPLQSMPNMSLSQSVAFQMMEENLVQLLPPAILKELHPWFDLARRQLQEENTMQSWLDKVHIEPPTLSLIPPDINMQIKNDIYQAVFEQKQIQAEYGKISGKVNDKKSTPYLLNPLAIVQRGAIIYLLATKIEPETEVIAEQTTDQTAEQTEDKPSNSATEDDKQAETQTEEAIRMFTLHRFKSVEILEDSPAIIPKAFSLKKYIQSGAMGFNEKRFDDLPKKGKKTRVTLTFDRQAGLSLLESKLANKQKVTFNEDDTVTVEAKINLTRQLVWWLRGFGKSLIHAEPKRLWQVVKDE